MSEQHVPETMSARDLAELIANYGHYWDCAYVAACNGDTAREADERQKLDDIKTTFSALGLYINIETDTFRPFVMHA